MKFHWSGHIRDFLLTLFKQKDDTLIQRFRQGLSLKQG